MNIKAHNAYIKPFYRRLVYLVIPVLILFLTPLVYLLHSTVNESLILLIYAAILAYALLIIISYGDYENFFGIYRKNNLIPDYLKTSCKGKDLYLSIVKTDLILHPLLFAGIGAYLALASCIAAAYFQIPDIFDQRLFIETEGIPSKPSYMADITFYISLMLGTAFFIMAVKYIDRVLIDRTLMGLIYGLSYIGIIVIIFIAYTLCFTLVRTHAWTGILILLLEGLILFFAGCLHIRYIKKLLDTNWLAD